MDEDFHRGETSGEIRENRREHVGAVLVRYTHPHDPTDRVDTKRLHGLVEVVDDALSRLPQSFTRLSERYPTLLTPEERHGQAFFQALDLNADRRLGPV